VFELVCGLPFLVGVYLVSSFFFFFSLALGLSLPLRPMVICWVFLGLVGDRRAVCPLVFGSPLVDLCRQTGKSLYFLFFLF
jgi:hypothetical protein